MTWIRVAQPSPENPELLQALEEGVANYPYEYRPESRGERRVPEAVMNDSIILSHSLIPGALKHAFAAYAALLDPALPLGRRQHEMIAATVSTLNRCFY